MAIANVQTCSTQGKASSSTTTTLTPTFLSTPTPGNLLVLESGAFKNITSVTSATTWTKQVSTGTTDNVEIWFAPNIVGGSGDQTISVVYPDRDHRHRHHHFRPGIQRGPVITGRHFDLCEFVHPGFDHSRCLG